MKHITKIEKKKFDDSYVYLIRNEIVCFRWPNPTLITEDKPFTDPPHHMAKSRLLIQISGVRKIQLSTPDTSTAHTDPN